MLCEFDCHVNLIAMLNWSPNLFTCIFKPGVTFQPHTELLYQFIQILNLYTKMYSYIEHLHVSLIKIQIICNNLSIYCMSICNTLTSIHATNTHSANSNVHWLTSKPVNIYFCMYNSHLSLFIANWLHLFATYSKFALFCNKQGSKHS